MRLGLDLRAVEDTDQRRSLAVEADGLGLWAILLSGASGTETTGAAELALVTENIHLAVWLGADRVHPLGLAEEVAVLDHLSSRRAIAVVDGPSRTTDLVDRYLGGELIDGVALAPPPAQTRVPVWSASEVSTIQLTGDLGVDRAVIDEMRDGGVTHAFVAWPGELRILARHLASRALTADFPQVVADMADVVDP